MKGAKPQLDNVVPMKGEIRRHTPDAPEFMSTEGRAVWDSLAPVLVAKDRLEPHFEHLFAAYCEACADFIKLTGELDVMGLYYEVQTRNGRQQKKVAAWGLRQDALATMQRLSSCFGMTPVDERRFTSAGQGDLLDLLKKQIDGAD